jgi:uncharacterized protein (TIGR02757 family)
MINQPQLNKLVKQYNQRAFIENDPICIPHLFTQQQDIEIAGLFAAVFAWGQRKTIIQKSKELLARMDHAPHAFILQHQESDLKKLIGFKHRTFNDTDLLYFVHFLKHWYQQYASLETAFSAAIKPTDSSVENGLINFYQLFFALPDAPQRTRKHLSSPLQKSACKRINMYLRWMVRKDLQGVDFGIWKNIQPAQLICPLDVHSGRVARAFGLLNRIQNDWQAATELSATLRQFDAKDPVKYDFALFGAGVSKMF